MEGLSAAFGASASIAVDISGVSACTMDVAGGPYRGLGGWIGSAIYNAESGARIEPARRN